MRFLCLLASALLLGATEPTKPNIVFVLIDVIFALAFGVVALRSSARAPT